MARPVDTRRAVARDALVILFVAAAVAAFYVLFKAVAVLAGLPFP